ncbi:MAG: HAMP domain-containing sensor histidine kinase [Candidatus Saccharibacteria bacterium]|nr:HAMP domain-containing sensor histidine kinase [Candidatus Saccharibacteria bacterium]
MTYTKSRSPDSFSTQRSDILLIILIVASGLIGSLLTATTVNRRNQNFLLARVDTIATALPAEDVAKLQGNESDLTEENYNKIKAKLALIRKNNSDIRFVYLTSIKDSQVYFLVDSEDSASKDYSPPGETYPEASPEFVNSFKDGDHFVEGPYRDRWGNWMSAIAPIRDPNTGQIIAMAGVDSSALNNFLQVALYATIPLLLSAIPLVILIRQIRIKKAEEEIQMLKRRFISIASHELRSPLTGMIWGTQSLLGRTTELNPASKELLSDMSVSARSVMSTINEILDLSIFEEGNPDKLQHNQVDLVSIITEVQKEFKLASKVKDIVIKRDNSWPEHAYVIGDSGAIRRGMMNIVSNAIKYSPETTQVTLGYQKNGDMHTMSVHDTGIGIPSSEIEKVTEGYYRASNATNILAHGTGIGLWVTKLMLEQHKGRLVIESQENIGTTVYLSIPIASKPTTA